jgi:hypothetical protein
MPDAKRSSSSWAAADQIAACNQLRGYIRVAKAGARHARAPFALTGARHPDGPRRRCFEAQLLFVMNVLLLVPQVTLCRGVVLWYINMLNRYSITRFALPCSSSSRCTFECIYPAMLHTPPHGWP